MGVGVGEISFLLAVWESQMRRRFFMQKNQTIFRTTKDRNNPYVMINKIGLEDTRLSWKARGILAYLLSKPDNWQIKLEHLEKQAPDGKTSLRSGIDELKKHGYLIRVAIRENKKIKAWEFWVNETPISNPVEKYIHIEAETLKEFLSQNRSFYIYTDDGKFLDTSLLTENRKVGKTRANSLLTENLEVGNLEVGNRKLLNNDFTNYLSLPSNDSSSVVSHSAEFDKLNQAWQKCFKQEIDQTAFITLTKYADVPFLVDIVDKIKKHHKKRIDSPFAFVFSCVQKGGYMVEEPKEQEEKPAKQGGQWKPEKKPVDQEKMPAALRMAQEQPQQPANQEDMEEKQRQIWEKLKEMNERFNQRKERKPEHTY
jgi:hypothetical protein